MDAETMIDVHRYVADMAIRRAKEGEDGETIEKLDELASYVSYVDYCMRNEPGADHISVSSGLVDAAGRELAAMIGADYGAITSLPGTPISAAAIDGVRAGDRLIALAVRNAFSFACVCCESVNLEVPRPADLSLEEKVKARKVEALKATTHAIGLSGDTAVRAVLSALLEYIEANEYLSHAGAPLLRIANTVSLIVSTCRVVAGEIGSDYVAELKMSDRGARVRARREDWPTSRLAASKAIREWFVFAVALCGLHGFPAPEVGDHD